MTQLSIVRDDILIRLIALLILMFVTRDGFADENAAHGMCYLSSGYVGDAHRPTFAIRPGGSGDIAPDGDFENSEFIEWYQPQCSPYNTTQIVYGDYLYTVYDQGFMTCHNALTGAEVYGKRRFSPKGSFTASPWAYGGKVFCLSEVGLTYVIKAGPEFEILEANPLEELCIATPQRCRWELVKSFGLATSESLDDFRYRSASTTRPDKLFVSSRSR